MGETVIRARQVIGLPDDGTGPGWLQLRGDRIAGAGRGAPPRPADLELDGLLVPGLIDAQINGAFAVDFAEAGTAEVRRTAELMLSTGVTTMVPTFITSPVDELVAQVWRYDQARLASNAQGRATRLLAAHGEGPFLSPRRRGAHREEHLIDPTPEALAPLLAMADRISYVTLAPERAGAVQAIVDLIAAGVRVSIGHSDADDTAVRAAADAGASMVTHLYNAQRPLHHRDPGVVGAALTDPRLTLGLISDGYHVEPTAIRLAVSAAPGRVMLVTDAVAALGMPPGRSMLGGEEIVVSAGSPPLRADGTIAGADVPLDGCLRHAMAAGVELVDVVRAATRTPADALGQPDRGRLEPGALADLVLLDADDLKARATWLGGELAWSAESPIDDSAVAT